MYIVYNSTVQEINGDHFGYVSFVNYFLTLDSLKQFVEIQMKDIIANSKTPYIREENIKFLSAYEQELDSGKTSNSCKYADNFLTIYPLRSSNNMIYNSCQVLDVYLFNELKKLDFHFICKHFYRKFTSQDFFNIEYRLRNNGFMCDVNSTHYFSYYAAKQIKEIIKYIMTVDKMFIEDFVYKSNVTGLSYSIDEILNYNGEMLAVCREINSNKKSLINTNELDILSLSYE